jgi:hypothetical protein
MFTVGAISLSIIGFASSQHDTLPSNALPAFLSMAGIWQWRDHQRSYEEREDAAETLAADRTRRRFLLRQRGPDRRQ